MTFCLFKPETGFERAFFHFQENWEQILREISEYCSFLLRKTFTKFQTVSCSLCRIDWESLLSIGSAFFVSPIHYKGKRDDAYEENHIQCSAQSQGLQLRADADWGGENHPPLRKEVWADERSPLRMHPKSLRTEIWCIWREVLPTAFSSLYNFKRSMCVDTAPLFMIKFYCNAQTQTKL